MCDSFVVVARPDRILFGKNSDRDPNEAQRLDWVPAREHGAGARLACTWITIPQVDRTHAVLLSRPYWMWGAEMGLNEHGVVVGNQAVFTLFTGDRRKVGLLGMDLVRLALERAASAEEAVGVIRQLLAAHGQGGRCGYDDPGFDYDNSFLVADADRAFVVETAGRKSEVEEVHAGVRAISNGLTLPSMQRHADPLRGRVARCATRRRRVEALGADAATARSMAAVLRDHGEGFSEPRYELVQGALAGPCAHAGGLVANTQTVGSLVVELPRGGAPRAFATGTAAPCLAAYVPVRVDTPQEVGEPTGACDERSVFWRFERLHRRVIGDPDLVAPFRTRQSRWERATWEGERAPERAMDELREQLGQLERAFPRRTADLRPLHARRYWAARERDARRSVGRLPPRAPAIRGVTVTETP